MELTLKPHHKNIFPLGGLLIRSASAVHWLKELQQMGLSLPAITVYAIPDTAPTTIWGCLVVYNFEKSKIDVGQNMYCQWIHHNLFVPEKTLVYPQLSLEEMAKLFTDKLHLFHPQTGLVELAESVDWPALISAPQKVQRHIREPFASHFIPQVVKTFQVKPVAAEQVLETLEETHFPKREKFTDKPLNPLEKVKLFLYQQLFSKIGRDDGNSESGIEKKSLLTKLESLRKLFGKGESNWPARLEKDYEELEKRNQKHFDRLMELLHNNPGEALKYAVPLDNDGSGRGGFDAAFNLQKRWGDFSLFGGNFNIGGGSALLPGDAYSRLYDQYTKMAQQLIKEGDYRKAAFVYLKLLKNNLMAADTLEKGGLYSEAASVYLKYCDNKTKAAACYEKGAMTSSAIELYKELNENEKVGDLYISIYKKKEAFSYYQKVADGYTENHQYLKASLLYKNKMEADAAAQRSLLTGWRLNRDAFNCLNNYFVNLRDTEEMSTQLQSIYEKDVNPANRETFLRVLQQEHSKSTEHAGLIKDIAHEIIVDEVKNNPAIIAELRTFNKEDKQIVKDTMHFKLNVKK